MKDQTRNLHPHAEALLYAWMFGEEYSQQRGGVMDFWDKASDFQKKNIRELLDLLLDTKREIEG
jgi:hypothetical protein